MKVSDIIVIIFMFFTVINVNAAVVKSISAATQHPDGYSVELINHCDAVIIENPNELILFDHSINRLSGWSHADSIAGLDANSSLYTAKIVKDPACHNMNIYQNTLVKKYTDWNAQHVNGIEPLFKQDNIELSAIENIVLELKVHSEGTSIPSQIRLKDLYGEYLTKEQLRALDKSLVNLSVTLFGEGFDDQSKPTLNGAVYLAIDQHRYADKWVRVIIAASNLRYYTEQNYVKTTVLRTAFENKMIVGLRINPETDSGKVVRHFIKGTYESIKPPEPYKKMKVSFKKVGLVLK